MKVHLLFPLLSSLLYVVGVLFMKQCASRGVGVWRTSFVVNLATAVLFVPVLAFGGVWRPWADHWQPAVTGLLFIGGQTLTLVALRHGDVSLATPVMGLKTMLVALLVPLILGEPVSGKVWWAAAMSAGGIGLLNLVRGARHHHVGSTLLLSGAAAASFALFDVLVTRFAPAWGIGRFLPAMLAWVTLFSLLFIPFFSAPLREVPRVAMRPLTWGTFFIALQGLVLICALGRYGDAAAMNVIYSSRGLWSVLAVWAVGHWFGNDERFLGGAVLKARAAGAALMLGAIILTLV